ANREHLAILKTGVTAWNDWRAAEPDVVPNLTGAYLRRTKLAGADFSRANLFSCNLRKCNLEGADFNKTHLDGADLSGANLRGANLRGVYLRGTNLNRVEVAGTSFSYARMGLTVFGDVDLSRAHGLGSVRHDNPSTIGVDTIYRSGGKIPAQFLR